MFNYNGSQYTLTSYGTWQEAQAQAQSLGGNLVTINNQAEQDWLVSTFGVNQTLWIGLTDEVTEGTFKWVSGEISTYTNWLPGEPNNGWDGEDYVEMNFGSPGKWNDSSSNQFRRGIVEITNISPSITLAVSPSSVLEDGTTNLIYTFTRTGATTNPLTINYGITGTANSGDYTGATPGTGKTITFAAGASTTTLTIDPIADTTVENNETVALTLVSGTGYTVGTTTAVTGTIINDDSTFNYNNSTYLLTNLGTWQQAQAQAQSVGGNLVTINSQAEQDWLISTFGSSEQLWIGLTDQVTEGQFKWASGEISTYTNWYAGQPDNGGPNGEDYVVLNYGSAGKWNDYPNDLSSFRGIIEITSPTYTPIESTGNTKLIKDITDKYFTQIGTNTPIAIKNGGQQIFQNIYPGWQTLAAETVNGENQVLWKNTAGNYLHIWRLDNNWNRVSSEGQFALNSAAAFTQETNFGIDTNGDGIIGSPYTTVESSGNTKLVKDTANKFFAQVGEGIPTAINNGGVQIFQNIYAGWQTLAAETVNGVNQVLWKNVSGNFLHIWRLDNNWNWVSSEGQFGFNSADAFTQETNFGIDANGDGVIGNPAGNPYILIESSGNTKLVKDTDNKFFAQVGQTIPTAIKNSGVQIFQDVYAGWQTLAAETVNGVNQVLWKNISGNFLHIWNLDNNWNWVSSEGQYALNSADAFTQETKFGIDANGDGVIGSGYTAIESAGNTKLVKDATNKYFAQVGTSTPTAIKNGGVQIFQDVYAGWQTLAAETVNGVNQVLWKNISGNFLHIWNLDNNWNWVSSEGQFALNSADALAKETVFGIDANSDGAIGNPSSLTLTGTNGNDILIGGTNNDVLTGAGGKDTLTGGLGSDKFVYQNLTDSLLANFDVITDFNATPGNDLFRVSTALAGFVDVGAVNTLDAAGIGAKLAAFGSNYAAQFSFGQRTFVAINDAIAGFNAANDAIIEVTGLTGTLNVNNFVIV
ncbi:Poly(beta-D-mannuronate) C5 epimerase 5 [Dolichospermum sp. UHCC 0315A]|uniref:lectin-like protein n=1 Tax=Dolichospermum sp. UHCC 0315A TaxID=1914871 RepID=UPI001255CA7D|nr:lectin-like protein [Dolichospermum sp. UHCC 0315A]QEI41650.1 Poly(beta-D-mannuronate) C5 epimerase 5 [Dolichospermum sp. UHCC 0315A]